MNDESNDRLSRSQDNFPRDARPKVTRAIWGCATGMLGISIPLSAVTHTSYIPLAVIAGAAAATVAIWTGKGVEASRPAQESATAVSQAQLKELEERLAAIESINLLERRLMERAQQAELAMPQAVGLDPVPAHSPESQPLQNRAVGMSANGVA